MGKHPLPIPLPSGPPSNNPQLKRPSPPSCLLATAPNFRPARFLVVISMMPMAPVFLLPFPPTVPPSTRHASASTLALRPFPPRLVAFATVPVPLTPMAWLPSLPGITASATSRMYLWPHLPAPPPPPPAAFLQAPTAPSKRTPPTAIGRSFPSSSETLYLYLYLGA